MCNQENSLSHASRASNGGCRPTFAEKAPLDPFPGASIPSEREPFGLYDICIKDEVTGVVRLEEKRGFGGKRKPFQRFSFCLREDGIAQEETVLSPGTSSASPRSIPPQEGKDFCGSSRKVVGCVDAEDRK